MTSKGSMEGDLLRETGRSLARLGFSSRANGQTFLRPLDGGFAAAHLAFVEHEFDIDVTIDVAIRFNAVEDLAPWARNSATSSAEVRIESPFPMAVAFRKQSYAS